MSTTGKIFINYRRDDARGIAGRLSDSLTEYFGDGRVFRDVQDIAGGANFEHVLAETIGSADAIIVLIGPDWLTMKDAAGQRRLDDPHDFVAQEIAAALEKKLPIYPVLIEDTPMPRADDLPDALKALVRHNAMSVSDHRWEFDVTRLAKVVAFDIPGSAIERKLDRVRMLISVLLFACMVFTTGTVAWNAYNEVLPPLKFWQSGVSFVAILGSAVLLLVCAPQTDATRRRYVYAAGIIGLAGSFVCYILVLPLNTAGESIANFFGSTVIATAILGLMNLSGFKPK